MRCAKSFKVVLLCVLLLVLSVAATTPTASQTKWRLESAIAIAFCLTLFAHLTRAYEVGRAGYPSVRALVGALFVLVAVGGCDINPDLSSGSSGDCNGGGFGGGGDGGGGSLTILGCTDPQAEGNVWVEDVSTTHGARMDVPIHVLVAADSVSEFSLALTLPSQLIVLDVVPWAQAQGWSIDHARVLNSVSISGAAADSSAAPRGGYGQLAIVRCYVYAGGDGRSFVLSSLQGDIVDYRACPGK